MRSHWQRPLDHYYPSLVPRAFWDAATIPAAVALEAAFPQILAECQQLMAQRRERFVGQNTPVRQVAIIPEEKQLLIGQRRAGDRAQLLCQSKNGSGFHRGRGRGPDERRDPTRRRTVGNDGPVEQLHECRRGDASKERVCGAAAAA